MLWLWAGAWCGAHRKTHGWLTFIVCSRNPSLEIYTADQAVKPLECDFLLIPCNDWNRYRNSAHFSRTSRARWTWSAHIWSRRRGGGCGLCCSIYARGNWWCASEQLLQGNHAKRRPSSPITLAQTSSLLSHSKSFCQRATLSSTQLREFRGFLTLQMCWVVYSSHSWKWIVTVVQHGGSRPREWRGKCPGNMLKQPFGWNSQTGGGGYLRRSPPLRRSHSFNMTEMWT